MLPRQRLFAIILALGLILLIVDLVRRRRLREEYSWLWILTGGVILALSIWYRALEAIARFIGVINPVSGLFFFGILFLFLIGLQFSVRISALTGQVKKLTQELAILREKRK